MSILTEMGEVYRGEAHRMQSLPTSEETEVRSLRKFQEGFSIPRPSSSACHSPVLESWVQGSMQPLVSTAHHPSAPSDLEGALPSWAEPASPHLHYSHVGVYINIFIFKGNSL